MMGGLRQYPPGMKTVFGRNTRLRALIRDGLVVAPGCYDCITARLIELAGFPAAYVTGSGISMSALGAPDVGLMSFSEVLDRVKRIADLVSIPIIADADTGYGGPLNVMRTVREMERAGVSAVQIEDQSWPKKCGHEPRRRLVTAEEMVGRIKASVDARVDRDLVIIARTDARTTEGLERALERAVLYADAGADVLFVEAPESEDDMQRITAALSKPTLVNIVEGGRTPVLPVVRLAALGYRIAIFPNSLTRALARAGEGMLSELSSKGDLKGLSDRMMNHRELWNLFDYPAWTSLEEMFDPSGNYLQNKSRHERQMK
jgi:2-methylisocitrate lyase-like PEP mutase family enzyme